MIKKNQFGLTINTDKIYCLIYETGKRFGLKNKVWTTHNKYDELYKLFDALDSKKHDFLKNDTLDNFYKNYQLSIINYDKGYNTGPNEELLNLYLRKDKIKKLNE
jgi:chromosome condensin MukBEF MukE localization factor